MPRRVREEVDNCWHYYDEKERCIFCDIIRQERDTGERVIGENEHFITLAPYAPRFPFEMWLLPKAHGSSYENNQSSMYASLARMLKDTLMRLDEVLDRPAYNFMIHTSPIGEEINDHYHWHIEIIPKLTKVAGFEWGTGFYINPTPPEESARFLREAKIAAPAPAAEKIGWRESAVAGLALPGLLSGRFAILKDSARYPSGPRERSAKPPFVGSNPTRASNLRVVPVNREVGSDNRFNLNRF